MMLNVSRKVPLLIKDDFKMDMAKHSGIEVQGKSVGIVGLGNIGSEFAKLCDGIGMNVKYWSKNSRNAKYEYLELAELFKTCDVIYPSLAKNLETKNLISDEMLRSMPKSSILIANTKSVYNHNLAISLAENNLIYGYGFENGSNQNFKKFKGNIWAAPSMAWCTEECYLRNGELWLKEVLNVIKSFS
jgi:lactate dehydrogenase-like 2-hydroxyacid dehydrogenase